MAYMPNPKPSRVTDHRPGPYTEAKETYDAHSGLWYAARTKRQIATTQHPASIVQRYEANAQGHSITVVTSTLSSGPLFSVLIVLSKCAHA
ncbi:hypothetical protein CTA1_10803 [Colletotrichum tanaceti]|uniref:Uncharacterized protein n=1 Tax=Colletotrichum tanaceti TaxID=1306861 RepID=A0A4U6XGX0_9PEZI|nr:hypothetical protein CTA1_10803 [Colletotrichum tanaceti]